MEIETEGIYIYQPFGPAEQSGTDRLWGVSGIERFRTGVSINVHGLTRREAELVYDALKVAKQERDDARAALEGGA